MNLPHIIIRGLKKFKFLPYLNLTGAIEINNKTFVIPVNGGLGFDNLFLSEPWMTRLLSRLRPFFSGAFVDVGVNVGQTLLKVYAVNERVNYIGFEPNPICNYYTQELIRLNRFEGCKLIPAGIGRGVRGSQIRFLFNSRHRRICFACSRFSAW